MDQSASKPKWSWKTILLNLVILSAIFQLGYTLRHREGPRTLIMEATEMQALGLTNVNVVPRKIVDQ